MHDREHFEELYSAGSCHVHAIASHRMHGGSFLVITDPEEIYWESDEDPDDFLEVVVHVYSVHDGPDGPVARDIFGDQPLDQALGATRERFRCATAGEEILPDEAALMNWVDQDEDVDRPLHGIIEADIREAMRLDTVATDPGNGLTGPTGGETALEP